MSGVTHRRLRVIKKTVDFGKPRGACDIDDWILAQNPHVFSRMVSGASTFANSGLTVGYDDGPAGLEKEGTFTYDESICGFTWQDTPIFSGTEAAWCEVPHPEFYNRQISHTVGAVISYSSTSLTIGQGALITGIKDGDAEDFKLALVLMSDGSVGVVQDGEFVFSGLSVPPDTASFVAVAADKSGAMLLLASGSSLAYTASAVSAMPASTFFNVGACVEAGAVEPIKVQTGISVVPFEGRIERAFFTKSRLSDRAAGIANSLVVLKTYYDPQADYESSPSA